ATAADDPLTDRQGVQARGTLTFALSDALTLKSITAYTDIDNFVSLDGEQSGAKAATLENIYASESYSEEINLSGDFGPLQAVLGGFYYQEDLIGSQNLRFDGDVFVGFPDDAGGVIPILIFPSGTSLIQE